MAVYFIRQGSDGPIKIGHTSGPVANRLCNLQSGSAERLTVLGIIDGGLHEERALHAKFRADRLSGEWFNPSAELLAFVAQHASETFIKGPAKKQTPLGRWLVANKITALEMGAKLGLKQPNSIYRWLRGELKPSDENMRRIVEITDGAVMPNDFLDVGRKAA